MWRNNTITYNNEYQKQKISKIRYFNIKNKSIDTTNYNTKKNNGNNLYQRQKIVIPSFPLHPPISWIVISFFSTSILVYEVINILRVI